MAFTNRRPVIVTFAMMALFCWATVADAQVECGSCPPVNQAYQFTDAVQPGPPPTQYATPVVDPLRTLEEQVYSLQCQVNSMRPDGSCKGCKGCGKNMGVSGFYFSAAAVFAKPHYKEAFQHSQTNIVTGQQLLVPFGYDYESTPRFALGYKAAGGFGFRTTYWNFDAAGQTSTNVADGMNIYGAHAITVIFPANIFAQIPGEQMQNSDSLRTQILNFYATYDSTVGGFEMSGGVGLRSARLEQDLNSVVFDAGGAPIRQLVWQRRYEGLGPAITVDAKRRIGCSPFSIFAQGGGSFLFGNKTIDRTVLGDQSPQPASPFLTLDDADEVVGIGELGFGFEWSRSLPSDYNLTLRGSYEGSLWAEAGAPTLGFLGFEGFGVQIELKR